MTKPAFACLGGLHHAVATLQRGEGGKGGIRTLGTLSDTQSFQDCRLNRSRTFPNSGLATRATWK